MIVVPFFAFRHNRMIPSIVRGKINTHLFEGIELSSGALWTAYSNNFEVYSLAETFKLRGGPRGGKGYYLVTKNDTGRIYLVTTQLNERSICIGVPQDSHPASIGSVISLQKEEVSLLPDSFSIEVSQEELQYTDYGY